MTLLLMIAPGGLFVLPRPWNVAYATVEVAVWLIAMVFLARRAGAVTGSAPAPPHSYPSPDSPPGPAT